MKTIKKISAKPVAKLSGLVNASFGLVFGLLFSVISLFSLAPNTTAFGFGVGSIVILPLVYGMIGWVMGYFLAWTYNFFAKHFGGIQIELE